ncbi:MAG: 2-amino-4-hydroxy-6-hydroxymethyldihydropteridine diphosphokinase [Acetobacterales bacterium]
MIYIGIGSNLATAYGSPQATCEAALSLLADRVPVRVQARSPWYRSAPVPASDQPWYVNGVAAVATDLPAEALLAALLGVEGAIGRVRTSRNAPRGIDLDLLDYHGERHEGAALVLPHPRMAERAFVLVPLADVAPDWRHPVTGKPLSVLLARLPEGQATERI